MPADDHDLQATKDALERLRRAGSNLGRPLQMDFFVAVPDEPSGVSVARLATALGFTTSVEQDSSSGHWTCYCTKTVVPSFEMVTTIERQLDDLARPMGGHIDGFGSFGNTPDVP